MVICSTFYQIFLFNLIVEFRSYFVALNLSRAMYMYMYMVNEVMLILV